MYKYICFLVILNIEFHDLNDKMTNLTVTTTEGKCEMTVYKDELDNLDELILVTCPQLKEMTQ